MNQTTTANAESVNELKEGLHYRIYKDGHGAEHKIAIHTHPLFCNKTSGKIELKAFRVDLNFNKEEHRPDIETKTSFKMQKDKLTGLIFGEPIGIDQSDKQIKWKKIPLRMINTYDMSVASERNDWALISRASFVEGSPNQSGRPLYKVIDSEAKNLDFMQTIVVRDSASQIIKGMSGNQLIDYAPSIGIHAGNYSADGLRTEFFRYIENNSKKFMDIWNNPSRDVAIQFQKALQLSVVTRVTNNGQFSGYYYEQFPMGISEGECIAWLNQVKNSAVLSSMVIATQQKESSIHRGNTKIETSVKVDPEKETMAKELEKLRAELLAAQTPKQETKQEDPKVSESNEGKAKVAFDLEALKIEAKGLKIPGYQLAKDPEKLQAKIDEAKLKLQTA